MKYLMLHWGGTVGVHPSLVARGEVLLTLDEGKRRVDVRGVRLTPDEARGLAQRLLKEAAEVEFAGKLHDEAVKP